MTRQTWLRHACPTLALGLAGCGAAAGGAARTPSPAPAIAAPSHGPTCGARASSLPARPVALPRAGSTVALATQGGKTLAFTADEDDGAVQVFDVESGKAVGSTLLDGRPSTLMFLADGRLVVLLRDKSKVQVMQPSSTPGQLETLCSVDVASEPVGIAASPNDETLFVTSGWGRALTALDAKALNKAYEVPLAREPRSIVVTDDGAYAYVSHAVGARASKVDLRARTVQEVSLHAGDPSRVSQMAELREEIKAADPSNNPSDVDNLKASLRALEDAQPSCQGFALAKSVDPVGRIFAPQVLVDTGDPSERRGGYGNDESETEVSDIAVIDERGGEALPASLERRADSDPARDPNGNLVPRSECLLPRAAAFMASRKSLLVSCFGIDQVIEYDAVAGSPARAERNRWNVAAGPNGIAVDPDKNRAVVWSQFERTLDVLELGSGELVDDQGRSPVEVRRVALPANPGKALSMQAALGRLLFHSVGDPRISRDGRACASCHPDGRDDSLVWATPEGPRRSIMLAGRLGSTAPYAWSGDHADLKAHLATTFDRLNGTGGLKGYELDALVAYIQTLPPPPSAAMPHDARIDRGAELFASPEVGCSACHKGPAGTDGDRHDVHSRGESDAVGSFDTPSLRFVGGTGPYFHDGRYRTLHDVLASNNDQMGRTKQLSPQDLDALEAYLRTR